MQTADCRFRSKYLVIFDKRLFSLRMLSCASQQTLLFLDSHFYNIHDIIHHRISYHRAMDGRRDAEKQRCPLVWQHVTAIYISSSSSIENQERTRACILKMKLGPRGTNKCSKIKLHSSECISCAPSRYSAVPFCFTFRVQTRISFKNKSLAKKIHFKVFAAVFAAFIHASPSRLEAGI